LGLGHSDTYITCKFEMLRMNCLGVNAKEEIICQKRTCGVEAYERNEVK